MKVRWKKLLTNSLIWLTAEICFNCLGLDTIADYSEFVFDRNYVSYQSYIVENNDRF